MEEMLSTIRRQTAQLKPGTMSGRSEETHHERTEMVMHTVRGANQHLAGGRRARWGLALGGLAFGREGPGRPRSACGSGGAPPSAAVLQRSRQPPVSGCRTGRTEVGVAALLTNACVVWTPTILKSWKDSRTQCTRRNVTRDRKGRICWPPRWGGLSSCPAPARGRRWERRLGLRCSRRAPRWRLLPAPFGRAPAWWVSEQRPLLLWVGPGLQSRPSLAVLGPWCWASQERVWTWWWSKPSTQ